MTIFFPFLRGKKHFQGEADYHSKACREIKRLGRLYNVAKRRANKLLDSKPLFYGRKTDRSSNFQVENKLRNFVLSNATQFQ